MFIACLYYKYASFILIELPNTVFKSQMNILLVRHVSRPIFDANSNDPPSRLEYSRYANNFWQAHAPLQDLRVDFSRPVIRCPMPSYQSYRACTGLLPAFACGAPDEARSIVGPLSLVGCDPLVNTHILVYYTCV